MGCLLGSLKENLSKTIIRPLIKFGIPISLMWLLLRAGLDLPTIRSATFAKVVISALITIICSHIIIKNFI